MAKVGYNAAAGTNYGTNAFGQKYGVWPGSEGGSGGEDTPNRIDELAAAGDRVAAAGQEDIAGEEGVIAENRADAQALADEQKIGQDETAGKFDAADQAAEEGKEEVDVKIQQVRGEIARMTDRVEGSFDRWEAEINKSMEGARTGLGEMRSEALAGVTDERAAANDAAVAGIQGATRQQISDIDAQVQQGTLSPSQAQAMKTQIRMGGAMQLSAAVGQTALAFAQTSAEVATSFGTVFGNMESSFAGTKGQFGAAAGTALANAQVASAQLNTQLTGMNVQVVANRNAALSQNAVARATYQANNDSLNMQMLDYTENQWVQRTPAAANDFLAATTVMSAYMKSEEMEKSLALMREANQWADIENIFGIFGGIMEAFG